MDEEHLFEERLFSLSDAIIDSTFITADELAHLVSEGTIAVEEWRSLLWWEIEQAYIKQWAVGAGWQDEKKEISTDERRDILALLAALLILQAAYLDSFADEIRADGLTAPYIANRSRLYIASSRQAFERGRGYRLGWQELPAYPGDGSTLCMTNCRCHWLQTGENRYKWVLDFETEHCSSFDVDEQGRPRGCIERAILWNPLVIGGE